MLRALLVLASLAAVPATAADIYRCQARDGSTIYQQRACDDAGAGGVTAIPAEFPPVNTAERERLLAREAALDRRLEAQRERLAREAELREQREAERARLAAAEAAAIAAATPQWIVVSPAVRMRAASGNPRSRPRP